MSNTSLEEWERTRSKGKQYFIWTNGLLLWSVITGAVLYGLLEEMEVFPSVHCLVYALIGTLGVAGVGYIYGCKVWKANETAYEQLSTTAGGNGMPLKNIHRENPVRASKNGSSRESAKSQPKTLNDYIKAYEQLTFSQIKHNGSGR